MQLDGLWEWQVKQTVLPATPSLIAHPVGIQSLILVSGIQELIVITSKLR